MTPRPFSFVQQDEDSLKPGRRKPVSENQTGGDYQVSPVEAYSPSQHTSDYNFPPPLMSSSGSAAFSSSSFPSAPMRRQDTVDAVELHEAVPVTYQNVSPPRRVASPFSQMPVRMSGERISTSPPPPPVHRTLQGWNSNADNYQAYAQESLRNQQLSDLPTEYHQLPSDVYLDQQDDAIELHMSRPYHQHQASTSSTTPLTAAAGTFSQSTPNLARKSLPPNAQIDQADSMHRVSNVSEDPQSYYLRGAALPGAGYEPIDPRNIVDDGDDGLEPSRHSSHDRHGTPLATVAAAGTSGGLLGALKSTSSGGRYGPLPGGSSTNLHDSSPEKSEWLARQNSGNKRLKITVGILIVVLIVSAIVGGTVGGMLSKKHSSPNDGQSVPDSAGDLSATSPQIKALMNNPNLHRVFPGIDYTPLNAQYPFCLVDAPSQNNITQDVAMLSQLTNAIRLYGTDCKQTEMVLHAIDRLNLNSTVKVWLGVWLGKNATTNDRQLSQMYDILGKYPASHFAGVIVGNEVLFRHDLTEAQLGDTLQNVRANLTKMSINLPVATSDLGDNWNATLVANTDIVMANVHPFFAGQTPEAASGWTWDFWQSHDVLLTATKPASNGSYPLNVISEVGWPSAGGNDCGTDAGCPNDTAGSVAGIDQVNKFMQGWVCPALANGTSYFWFEAFDEPWKSAFNSDKQHWEDKWGLMDADRKLKAGLKIPDCGGQVVQ
ncbi:hypothetical protein LTR50_005530 [Elasticomyces elasticus]|nr:hypothetical protein LTR50_005530 [Elasticomyces elasticus]